MIYYLFPHLLKIKVYDVTRNEVSFYLYFRLHTFSFSSPLSSPLFLECYTLVYETALSMFYERNVIWKWTNQIKNHKKLYLQQNIYKQE